jgi:Histidine phosphatase superfamily (branch 1)
MKAQIRHLVVGLLSTGLMSLGSAVAWADDESIVLDLVRHGESTANQAGIIDTVPPGAPLDSTGSSEATTVAGNIIDEFGKNNIVGVFTSDELRTVETAAPLASALGLSTPLPDYAGLNEIPAGVFEGDKATSLEGILYLLGPISWALGFPLVPDLGDPSVNGVTFDQSFGGAIQDIYTDTVGAVGSTATSPTDVAFSSEGAIAVWTLMNVNNPDFSVLLHELITNQEFLPNTGQVVIDGSPGDWTLVSYDGTAVPQDPGLGTELFVDVRNLLDAPQFAAYDIHEALVSGGSAAIDAAIHTSLSQLDTALSQFPVELFDQVVTALGGSL